MSWSTVPTGLPGHDDPAQTLGNFFFVEHNNKRRILENNNAFEIKRSKQEQ